MVQSCRIIINVIPSFDDFFSFESKCKVMKTQGCIITDLRILIFLNHIIKQCQVKC